MTKKLNDKRSIKLRHPFKNACQIGWEQAWHFLRLALHLVSLT
jgi:hypothetical protein